MDLQKMDQLIDSWKDELFEKLGNWVAINSVMGEPAENAPFGKDVRAMLDLFLKDAAELGFEVDDVDGYAGAAQLGTGEQTMGILAHLDIVPAGDGWTYDPFKATMANGRFYGRGTMDDKGPAIAALYAMRAVRDAGIPLKHAVRLIAGCNEENGSEDMVHYKEVRKAPDYAFSPDAEYPVINIEKGMVGAVLTRETPNEDGATIPVFSLNAGKRRNIVPGSATAVLGTQNVSFQELEEKLKAIEAANPRFKLILTDLGDQKAQLEAIGLQSHAAMPEQGFNAAGELLQALCALGAGKENGALQEAIAGIAKCVGTEYDGASLGICQSDEISGPLTCNMGLLRYDGTRITAELDIRFPICANSKSIGDAMKAALAPWHVEVLPDRDTPPLHVPADCELVKGLLEVYHELTGNPAYPIAIGGGTYSKSMPNTVAYGICFPGDIDTCHIPDEYVDVEKFMLSVHIMAHAIVRLAGA